MRLRVLIAAALAVVLSAVLTSRPSLAEVEVDVTQGQVQPLPISIAPFAGEYGAEIAKVVGADLERSGFFKLVPPAESGLSVNVQPRFDVWQRAGAQALVNGAGVIDADGRLRVDFRLWDVYGQQHELLGLQYAATPENRRRIAHKIADAVYEKLTGQKGYFDSRIVFVAESGPKTARITRLAIMDQDGYAPQYFVEPKPGEILMTPRFSSSSQQITYMALGKDYTRIYLLDLNTNRQETLGTFNGMVFAPRFSPDGTKVAFSNTRGGNSDVWVMDLRTRQSTRLTADPGIDTSPSFSPDGRSIVFNSDRAGSPQLYVMNADGSNVRRISRGGGRYNTPVWSPTGDLIAFTKQSGGQFSIGVMNSDGSGERILTSSYFVEGPSWSPNGRYIMFHREAQNVRPSLWMIDLTGQVERVVPYPSSGSDPAWSPLQD
jgi:TolB protein